MKRKYLLCTSTPYLNNSMKQVRQQYQSPFNQSPSDGFNFWALKKYRVIDSTKAHVRKFTVDIRIKSVEKASQNRTLLYLITHSGQEVAICMQTRLRSASVISWPRMVCSTLNTTSHPMSHSSSLMCSCFQTHVTAVVY